MSILDPSEVLGVLRFRGEPTEGFYVSVPRADLCAATTSLNTMLRGAAPLTPQWRLFLIYARGLHAELPHLAPEESVRCAAHMQDLALIALGATREAAEIDAGRGVCAARLKAVKADIESQLSSPI